MALASCGGSNEPDIDVPEKFTVLSESFDGGGELPERFTCDGGNVSPSLGWEHSSPAPSYAISMIDRDANNFAHWTVIGIPPNTTNFPEGHLPSVAMEGANDFGGTGYRGPCPPTGDSPHHYVFTVYALDRPGEFFAGTANSEPLSEGFTLEQMLTAIECCVTASGTVEVTYER